MFEQISTAEVATPIPSAFFTEVVVASVEHIPSSCTSTGLLSIIPSRSSLPTLRRNGGTEGFFLPLCGFLSIFSVSALPYTAPRLVLRSSSPAPKADFSASDSFMDSRSFFSISSSVIAMPPHSPASEPQSPMVAAAARARFTPESTEREDIVAPDMASTSTPSVSLSPPRPVY